MAEPAEASAGTTQPTIPPPGADAKPDSPDAMPDSPKSSSKTKKIRGRPADPPDVTLSKTLSYILRHGASKERLEIRNDGCIRLDELLKRPKIKKYTIDDIKRVVAENEKQRFSIIEEEQADGTIVKLIRANQGHTLKVKRTDLKAVTDPSEIPTVVHGTYPKAWESIAEEGLKPMARTHIHFAKGLFGEDGVVSGMRESCRVFIYLDVEKCFQDKIEFFVSTNGVILSEGLPDSKIIPVEYFKKVVDNSGAVLYPLPDRASAELANKDFKVDSV